MEDSIGPTLSLSSTQLCQHAQASGVPSMFDFLCSTQGSPAVFIAYCPVSAMGSSTQLSAQPEPPVWSPGGHLIHAWHTHWSPTLSRTESSLYICPGAWCFQNTLVSAAQLRTQAGSLQYWSCSSVCAEYSRAWGCPCTSSEWFSMLCPAVPLKFLLTLSFSNINEYITSWYIFELWFYYLYQPLSFSYRF